MNQVLKNKRVLVTGGSRGIGAAVVKRLSSEGADVALTYSRSPDRADEVVKAAQALGVKSLAIQADSIDANAVVAAVERTVTDHVRLQPHRRRIGRTPGLQRRRDSSPVSVSKWNPPLRFPKNFRE